MGRKPRATSEASFIGLEVGTRMTIIRLQDNSLVLISPIEITAAIAKELDYLGEVNFDKYSKL